MAADVAAAKALQYSAESIGTEAAMIGTKGFDLGPEYTTVERYQGISDF